MTTPCSQGLVVQPCSTPVQGRMWASETISPVHCANDPHWLGMALLSCWHAFLHAGLATEPCSHVCVCILSVCPIFSGHWTSWTSDSCVNIRLKIRIAAWLEWLLAKIHSTWKWHGRVNGNYCESVIVFRNWGVNYQRKGVVLLQTHWTSKTFGLSPTEEGLLPVSASSNLQIRDDRRDMIQMGYDSVWTGLQLAMVHSSHHYWQCYCDIKECWWKWSVNVNDGPSTSVMVSRVTGLLHCLLDHGIYEGRHQNLYRIHSRDRGQSLCQGLTLTSSPKVGCGGAPALSQAEGGPRCVDVDKFIFVCGVRSGSWYPAVLLPQISSEVCWKLSLLQHFAKWW